LVIDDEPTICRLLTYQLSDAGYAVEAFQHAGAALSRLAYAPPDLILLDVMMPEISGWDLCRQIRSTQSTPIIMLTGKQSDTDVVTGLTCGADDYVVKPYSRPQLLARINAVLRRAENQPLAPSTRQVPRSVSAADMDPSPIDPQPEPQLRRVPQPSQLTFTRLGTRLADARRRRGISLHDASSHCDVRWEFLQALEREQFTDIPRAQFSMALKRYSSYLNVDLTPYFGNRPPGKLSPTLLPLVAVNICLLGLLLMVIVLF
jgi:DNA-binding response OmpR family regulator